MFSRHTCWFYSSGCFELCLIDRPLVFAVDKTTCVNTRGAAHVGGTIISVITGTKGERSGFKTKSEVLLRPAGNLMLLQRQQERMFVHRGQLPL